MMAVHAHPGSDCHVRDMRRHIPFLPTYCAGLKCPPLYRPLYQVSGNGQRHYDRRRVILVLPDCVVL